MKITLENSSNKKPEDILPNSFGGAEMGRTGISAVGLKGKRLDIQKGDPVHLESDQFKVFGIVTSVSHEPRTSLTQDGAWATIVSFKKREITRLDLPDVDDFANNDGSALSVLRSLAAGVKYGDAEKRETIVVEEAGELLPEDDIDISRELEQ